MRERLEVCKASKLETMFDSLGIFVSLAVTCIEGNNLIKCAFKGKRVVLIYFEDLNPKNMF